MHPVSNVSSQFEGNVNVTNGLNNPSGCDVLRVVPERDGVCPVPNVSSHGRTVDDVGWIRRQAILLIVVPADQAMEIEAFVENKDIGFVNPGQEAEIKIETFPYTQYGTLRGEVTHVSSDAINDEKRGLIYSSRVKLPRTTMAVENKTVNLTPGMAVTVEVKTGQRKVIEYFLSPLIEHVGESLRER